MPTVSSMTRRIGTLVAGIERKQLEQDAIPIALRWIREGLTRKLALIDGDIHTGRLPEDFAQRCAEIDQDQARRQTPTTRAALALYHQRYQVAGAKEALMARLERRA